MTGTRLARAELIFLAAILFRQGVVALRGLLAVA